MRIGQIRQQGTTTAAIFESNGSARPIPEYTVFDLIKRADVENSTLAKVANHLAAKHAEAVTPIIPLNPKEVWACGCTYQTSAEFRDSEHGTREGFYAHVHRSARPEIFSKGGARVCVGPGQPIGIRFDSNFTAPEPELALVLGEGGRIVGYTIANDVSAWDIERENPLYLPQSKVYTACCALGPVIVTADEIEDPYALDMTCTIRRGDQLVFEGAISTGKIARKFEDLISFLYRANAVPSGSVLLTGTGIIVTEDARLLPGDICTITVSGIGELSNPAAIVQ